MNTKDNNSNLPQNLSRVKPAAIWARVSTHDQRETSIPSQIDRCKEKLEQARYSVISIFQVDWSSTDLFSCPQFQELRSLIKDRDIEALAVFDRDRLEAKGLQRLVFLSECREAGVKLEICQGPPVLDEPEGQLVELALAIGKERQVLRARQGSRDGLHDRALKRRLPTSRHKLYGYKWQEERRLVPDENWPNVKLIFDMLLDGSTYWPIIGELKKRGILSPQGYPEWNKAAISNMVHNPSYTGRYYALKKQAVTPVKRNGTTYGNSSQKKLPLDEAHYIPEIEIVNPPITWEQRLQILDQLAKHQKLAQRNAKRDYLLRGMIFCGTHTGKKGEPRAYHGQPRRKTHYYVCPEGGCYHSHLPGPDLEDGVKLRINEYLFASLGSLAAQLQSKKSLTKDELEGKLSQLRKQREQKETRLAQVTDDHYEGKILDDVYTKLKERYEREIAGIRHQQDEILGQLTQIGRETEAVLSLENVRNRFWSKEDKGVVCSFKHKGFSGSYRDGLSNEEWRQLFETLGVHVIVNTSAERQQQIAEFCDNTGSHRVYKRFVNSEGFIPWFDVRLMADIPLTGNKAKVVGDIVLAKPEPVKRNIPLYPLRFSLPNISIERDLASILGKEQKEWLD